MTHLNNQSINSKNDIINDKLINNQPENKQFNHLFTIIKPLDSQNKSSSSSNHIEYLHRKQKRKGRIKKLGIKPECTPIFYSDNIHSKFNQDNIKRKIKTHFHNFIIAYLNKEIKSHCNGLQKFKFRKMESIITQDITILSNKKMLKQPISKILGKVSKKFKDRNTNINLIDEVTKLSPSLKNLLDTSYEEMYTKFYLSSNHSTFDVDDKDESFQEHLERISNKDGVSYMQKYKEHAMNFIEFFQNCKERKSRKEKEESTKENTINSIETEQKEKESNNCININNFNVNQINNYYVNGIIGEMISKPPIISDIHNMNNYLINYQNLLYFTFYHNIMNNNAIYQMPFS